MSIGMRNDELAVGNFKTRVKLNVKTEARS